MPDDVVLTVDPEFNGECWQLEPEEKIILAISLKKEGCRDPIIYWDDPAGKHPILDGYNRYAICQENGIPFTTLGIKLPSRKAAMEWIARNQMGRRNASAVQKSSLRAKICQWLEDQKREAEEKMAKQVNAGEPVDPPDEPVAVESIAQQVAKMTGVKASTVRHDRKTSASLEAIAEVSPALRDALVKNKISKRTVERLGVLPPNKIKHLEAVEAKDLNAACLQTIREYVRPPKPEKPKKSGSPVNDIRAITELRKQIGVVYKQVGCVVRAKTDAEEKCPGPAFQGRRHSEAIRHQLNLIFDAIKAIQDEIAEWEGEVG